MPKSSGGAQQLRRRDRVRVVGNCYRHYLRGLEGEITCVLNHGVIVALDNDPMMQQKIIAVGGKAGPKNPRRAQRQFQFNEVVKIDRT